MEERLWWPKMETYPTLVLNDHATEWASRIAEDEDRIEVDGEELEPDAPASLSSERFGNMVDTQPLEPDYAQAPQGYAADRVWSGTCRWVCVDLQV
jgi:hypothetical protein